MAGKERKVVGFRFPSWTSVGPATLGGVVEFMRGHEVWRIVTENDSYGEMEAVKIDAGWRGDGAILFRADEKELEAYRARGMAVVLTSTEGPDLGYPRVVPDNHEIGAMAARHFIEGNFSQIAFLARGETFYREAQFAPGQRVYARERLKGFRAELQRYQIEPEVHYLSGQPLWKKHGWRAIQAEVMEFLSGLPRLCGLFVVDDSLGAVVLRAADQLGIAVPDDLAVIGYGDDQAYCFSTFPALSSIVHPARAVGALAAELLWRQLKSEPDVSGVHVIPVSEVVPRESSDTLAVEDMAVREALAWIRRRAPHDTLRVTEVAERAGCSVTTLKERFARELGISPKKEIQRVRLRHLEHLLGHGATPLVEIARTMGFGSAHELGRFFRAATGMSPGNFRRAEAAPAIEAVIFDMDGTLFDSEEVYFEAFREAYAAQGGVLTRERYFQCHAGTTNERIEGELAAAAGADFDLEKFRSEWRERWDVLSLEHRLPPLPGVLDWLEELGRQQIAVAVASSSSRDEIDRSLALAGLDALLPARTGGDEVEHGKPDPAIFLLAAQRLGVKPERCLVIEDSLAGVTAGRAAGMRVIHVSRQASEWNDPGVEVVATLAEAKWPNLAKPLRQPREQ